MILSVTSTKFHRFLGLTPSSLREILGICQEFLTKNKTPRCPFFVHQQGIASEFIMADLEFLEKLQALLSTYPTMSQFLGVKL
jgi:hypothetical protein